MANAIKILLEAIDQASGVINQVTNATNKLDDSTNGVGSTAKKTSLSFTELNSAIQIGQQVIQALKDVYDATIVTFLKYAGEVDSLSNITGDSAENTSRLIQVTNLYGLSVEQLTVAQKKLAQQGQSLSEETLIDLASQYQKLTTGQDRQLFLTKNLGRASTEWGEILNQNTESLKEQYDTVAAGLILTDKQKAQAEELEVNQTILENNWKQIGVSLGQFLGPALTALTRKLNIEAAAAQIASQEGLNLYTQHKKIYELATAQVDAQNRQAVAMNEVTESIEEQQAAFDALSKTYETELGLMQTLQSEDESYIKKQDDVNKKIADTQAEIDALNAKPYLTEEQKTQLSDLQGTLEDLSSQYAQNATDHENATKKIVYSNLLQKLSIDGISDAEFAMAQQMGVSLGIFTQANANEAIALNTLTSAVADGKISQEQFATAVNGGATAVANLVNQINSIPGEVNSNININTYHNDIYGSSESYARTAQLQQAKNITGRAHGGTTIAGQMYEVNEGGVPEMLTVNNKNYLTMGSQNGTVTPLSNVSDSSNTDTMMVNALMSVIASNQALPRKIAHEIKQLEKYG